ncbi:MAG: Histidine kinase [Thelocarpon impressellum]|nr:MAG: Histidine kinase [Thelocarpon impressellum]
MRIPIREQLGLLVLLTSMTALLVVSVASWVNNYNFVVGIRSSRLTLTASLKASQLSSNLLLLQSSTESLAQSIVIQLALQRYNDQANNSAANWARAQSDVEPALGTSGQTSLLLQVKILPKNGTGSAGPYSLLNVTGAFGPGGSIELPFRRPDGTKVFLGEEGVGYPAQYYPNLTYVEEQVNSTFNQTLAYVTDDAPLKAGTAVLLGPFQVNQTFALLSLTVPIINNTSASDTLGYMSVIIDARSIYDVINDPAGQDNTGQTLLIGPDTLTNRFPSAVSSQNQIISLSNGTAVGDLEVRLQLPPTENPARGLRHQRRAYGTPNAPFRLGAYPAALAAFTEDARDVNNAGSLFDSKNEEDRGVAVGYALPQTRLCDWALLMEEDRAEAYEPIIRLRNVLLACVFGTLGAILLLLFPIAHLSVRPIRRLREATKKSVQPPGYTPELASLRSSVSEEHDAGGAYADEENLTEKRRTGLAKRLGRWRRGRRKSKAEAVEDARRRTFRIPGKVQDRKHLVQDELTDLTQTFNEMSDELMLQYARLEERVEERTRELEVSKKAAEAANESKTLFIANISHELKTPLNGILGMTAVCMQDDDVTRIKRSLGIIYKSGDLLLHLLTDLLTFSKNEIGRQLSLEEKEFRLSEISSQILNIFDKQAKEGSISLHTTFSGPDGALGGKGYGPVGTGKVRDMCLWGDQNRILQVIINLVSNSLKFTPPGQAVELRLRCLGEAEGEPDGSVKGSARHKHGASRQSRNRPAMTSSSGSSSSPAPHSSDDDYRAHMDAAAGGNTKPSSQITVAEGSSSPPLMHARTLLFEFEVEDSGPGIPEEMQERVFEPFVQGDLGLSKKYGGTGLGLSICSQLAKLMRGSIRLRSQEGVGSTFTMRIPLKFTKESADSAASSIMRHDSHRSSVNFGASPEETMAIPRAQRVDSTSNVSTHSVHSNTNSPNAGTSNNPGGETAAKPRLVGLSQPFFAPPPAPGTPEQITAMERAVAAASKSGDKVRVLVAEDNKVNQEVVLRMLKLEDIYDVTVARDGQEAYEMVKESMEQDRLFNLIFMDIQMPNLDGLQSTRLIREMGYSAPIVALTAFAEESNVKECMDSGMNYFLSKPIRRPALKQVLKNYCATIPEEGESGPAEKASPFVDENPSPGSS